MNRLTTLREIARAAGVSVSTVSRVVNGYEHVSEDVRRRVERAIKELNYQPNLLARALVSGKDTRQIGLIVYDVANPYFAEIATALENVAYQHGYSVILCNSSEGRNTGTYLQAMIRHRVDGVAITSGQLDATALAYLERLLQRDIPIVMSRERLWVSNLSMEHLDNKIGLIELDCYSGAKLATEYLVSLGHERIAFLFSLEPEDLETDPRVVGFREVLSKHGLEFNEDLVVTGLGFKQSSGARGMLELLSRKCEFTAVMTYNDLLAIGALAVCREEGIRVPEDLSVVGFDNIEASRYTYPPLTTVDVAKSKLGELMATYLISRIKENKEKQQPLYRRFPVDLVVRESTGVKSWSDSLSRGFGLSTTQASC